MKIVIIGCGKIGRTLTQELAEEDFDIVVVDEDAAALRKVIYIYDVIGIEGSATSRDILLEAGAHEADIVIAVTSADETNIIACMLAKKLGAKHTIARVRNPQYRETLSVLKDELGLSLAVNPSRAAAREISRALRFPSALNTEYFAKGYVEVATFQISEANDLAGMSLGVFDKSYKIDILVCALERAGSVTIPRGSTAFQAGDIVSIVGSQDEISKFCRQFKLMRNPVKSVMIVGGSSIAYYLAQDLETTDIKVRIIDTKRDVCDKLSDALRDTIIIYGDGTDKELLDEEGLADCDAFVTLTGFDEENIIMSMYAKSVGVSNVITKVDRLNFPDIMYKAGLDRIISPKLIAANAIVSYVRAMTNTSGSNVEALYKIIDRKAEALEFRVRNNTALTSKPLKELAVKENILIACIIRGREIIIPRGEHTIENGDSVVVVTIGHKLEDINDILR